MSLIDQYRRLPAASRIPDEVWAVQRIIDHIDRLRAEIAAEQQEIERITPAMMRVLRTDWTDDDLRAVGLLT